MKYLITLGGQGDIFYIVVGKAAFDWIESPRPSKWDRRFATEENVPQAVITESPRWGKDKLIDSLKCEVTTGSCENDRAIFLMEGYQVFTRYPKNEGPFDDEWAGCLY